MSDNIIDKIESGIEECAEFILILSKNSLASDWVKLEADMALIRSIAENIKIKIVKIDDCKVPLRFKRNMYLSINEDNNVDTLLEKLINHLQGVSLTNLDSLSLRRFVDRSREVEILQESIFDEKIKFVVMHGFYGIGKSTLLKEAVKRIWINFDLVRIPLSEAFFGSRLCLELATRAHTKLPVEGDSKETIKEKNFLAIEELILQNKIIVFDDYQLILNEFGLPNQDIKSLLEYCVNINNLKNIPIFIISSRKPDLGFIDQKLIRFLNVKGMKEKYIDMIIKMEVKDRDIFEEMDPEIREKLISSLCQYPLAAKLAAPLLDDYPPDFIIENVRYIKKLRIDIALLLLKNMTPSELQERILELLGFCENFMSLDELVGILEEEREKILDSIDYLVEYNFLEFNRSSIGLHPILMDLFSSKATSGILINEPDNLISKFKKYYENTTLGTLEYVHWLSRLQRILIMCGKFSEAQKFWFTCRGELKRAIRKLYIERKYALALQYCYTYLEEEPDDITVQVFEAKCFIRFEKYEEALNIIDNLLKDNPKGYSLYHQKGRVYLKQRNYNTAKEFFLKSLSFKHDYFPAIRDIGEALMELGNLEEAEIYLNQALDDRPLDQYILNLYGKLLGKQKRYTEAISRMENAVDTMPDSASFLFRLGWLYENIGRYKEAFDYYKKASETDPNFFEARLSLINSYIEFGKLELAKKDIDKLEKKLYGRGKWVLESLRAKYLLTLGQIEEAYNISLFVLKHDRSEITLFSATKIELVRAFDFTNNGLKNKAKEALQTVDNYLDEINKLNPNNPILDKYSSEVEQLKKNLNYIRK